MLIFWQISVITKQCFQNIRRTLHELLFQKYSKDIPGILQGYEIKILILVVSSLAMFFGTVKEFEKICEAVHF